MAFFLSIAVAIAVVFGGLSWLRLTPREKRQMAAREAARKLDFIAKVRPCGDFAKARHGQATMPFYALVGDFITFRLWRSGDDWVGETHDSASNQAAAELGSWLAEIPVEAEGVESKGGMIGVWWFLENESQLPELKDWLLRCPNGATS